MITSEELILIKQEYLKEHNYGQNFLCNVAEVLGLRFEFIDYLMDNLEGTTLSIGNPNSSSARWNSEDARSRLNWLDKHIKLLEDDNE